MTPAERAEANLGLVHFCAKRIERLCPGVMERDDLIATGNLALMEAAASYDEGRGTQFSTHAYRRVYYAMLDALRSQTGGRRRWHLLTMYSLERLTTLPDGTVVDWFVDPDADVQADVERTITRDEVRARVATLPERDRDLIASIYGRGETRVAVARRWGVSYSRVSQVHANILRRLRAQEAQTT